ncbi:MAG: hypothetical protein ACXVQ7_07790 [Actinomycetota bacterium]
MVALLLASSCSSKPWWFASGKQTCGTPAEYRLHGKITYLGSCAGNLGDTAPTATLRIGQTLDLLVTPGFWPVRTSGAQVLRQIRVDTVNHVLTYKAISEGTELLSAVGICYHKSQGTSTLHDPCPLLNIEVTS